MGNIHELNIVINGLAKTGKSTLLQMIEEFLKSEGFDVKDINEDKFETEEKFQTKELFEKKIDLIKSKTKINLFCKQLPRKSA